MKIGEKIRLLRIGKNLTQEELADRCELSKGFISQLERDLTSPSIATLVDILECLGTNLKDFFNETMAEKVIFTQEDIFVKQDQDAKCRIEWLIPNAQKNMMEPIKLILGAESATEPEDPHEGEEFGYLIAGNVHLHLGSQQFEVKKGESFYFKPETKHYLSNPDKSEAVILWISTPPSF
ncbi:MAG: helix-turn-helix domain-containing protein [bacterium]